MRSILSTTLLLLIIYSCSQKKNTSQTPSQATVTDLDTVSIEITKSEVAVDTLIKIKKIGTQILDGKMISYFDEKDIYTLIHLVTTPDSNDRKFYFKVFNSIKGQAREYMAQEVDDYSMSFCALYPNDFFLLADSSLKMYAYDIGELIRTEEEAPYEFAKEYCQKIREKCIPKYYDKVDKFYKDIVEEMDSRK